MQFHPLPPDLQDIGDHALSRLVKGPGNWIPQGLLTRPVVEFNLPSLYIDLRSLQKAAATRFGLNELEGALERRRALDAANSAEGAPLANLACPWRNGSIIHYICECLDWVRVNGIMVQIHTLGPGSLQPRIYLAFLFWVGKFVFLFTPCSRSGCRGGGGTCSELLLSGFWLTGLLRLCRFARRPPPPRSGLFSNSGWTGGRLTGVSRGADHAVYVRGVRIVLSTTANARLCELSRTLVLGWDSRSESFCNFHYWVLYMPVGGWL